MGAVAAAKSTILGAHVQPWQSAGMAPPLLQLGAEISAHKAHGTPLILWRYIPDRLGLDQAHFDEFIISAQADLTAKGADPMNLTIWAKQIMAALFDEIIPFWGQLVLINNQFQSGPNTSLVTAIFEDRQPSWQDHSGLLANLGQFTPHYNI